MIRAIPLFSFLNYCDNSPHKKEVLDLGAGVSTPVEPPLVRFYQRGYTTHGLEIDEASLAQAQRYASEHNYDLDIRLGDMRQIPFEDASLSFVYSYNAIFHLEKAAIAQTMREIVRVLKPGGLCFVNFLSVEDGAYGEGRLAGNGEYWQEECGQSTLHSYFEDREIMDYLDGLNLLWKEKRILDVFRDGEWGRAAFIDTIAQKPTDMET